MPTVKPSFKITPRHLLLFLTLGILIYLVADFYVLAFRYLTYPYEVDYGEGCTLLFFKQLKNYGVYFFDINHYPFSYATYPPIFLFVIWFFELFFPSSLMAGRFASLFSVTLIAPVLYFLLQRKIANKFYALLLTLCYLSFWSIFVFGGVGRLDTLVCLWILIGFWLFEKYSEPYDRKRYWAFLFFILAFFTKQNSILAPICIFFYLLLKKEERKHFLPSLFIYATPIIIMVLAFNLYTHGEFLKHLFFYTVNREWRPFWFEKGMEYYLGDMKILLGIGILGLFSKQSFAKTNFIYLMYFLLTLASLRTIGLTASNVNYFLEPQLANVLFAGVVLGGFFKSGAKEIVPSGRTLILIALIFLQAFSVLIFRTEKKIRNDYWMPGTHYILAYPVYRELDQRIKNTKGDILSENLTALLTNDREVFFGCSYPQAEDGKWSPKELVQDCQRKRFSLIVSAWRYAGISELQKCFEEQYEEIPDAIRDNYWKFYRPKN